MTISENIPNMTVGAFVEKLACCYSALIRAGKPVWQMPSVMLWGAPGVGKSQGVRQIAKRIEKETGKTVNVTDVRLVLFNPIDLRGIPTANVDKTLAVWLKPKIFDMDPRPNVVNILFLDELSAAPQSVQAAAYQITLDRIIGEHKLPDNCIVIAAGNRVTDKSVAFKMPRALANRLMHIDVKADFNAWRKWAIGAGVNEKVIGFLSFRQSYLLETDISKDDLAFTTPRTWEMVSNLLNDVSGDVEFLYPMIAGIVGNGVAAEFRSWCKIYADLPSIDKIFDTGVESVPKGTDRLYALTASMICYARAHTKDTRKIENSLQYAVKMPPDFSAVLVQGYTDIGEEFQKSLAKMPAFTRWMETKGKYLNGLI